ncbi:MAG TPA: glycerophosphodiester phosphodiesterase family protein [Croceibacterium sp.]|nr:glycerophosphodiester phosphodiesterase family protein [Croceibacterium sp.]
MIPDWLTRAVYAHRGWHGDGRIENSPSAFRAAIAAGLGIECDVQQSADGEPMVFHDWDLDRLTAQRGPVRRHTAAELARVPLIGGDPIWTLPQLLAEAAGRVPLLIELKSRRDVPFERLCGGVARSLDGYVGDVAVMSFDPRVTRWFARNRPEAALRGLVMTDSDSALWRRWALWRAHAQFLAYDVRSLPSRIAAAQRAKGLPLLTWTVSDPALLERARAYADAPIAEGEGLAEAMKKA